MLLNNMFWQEDYSYARELVDGDIGRMRTAVTRVMRSAIQLRTASLQVESIQIETQTNKISCPPFRLRSHFAQRFGDIHSDSDKTLARKGAVREAFNSPFWPFGLVTTSTLTQVEIDQLMAQLQINLQPP